jgi:hypothetical protein
MMVMSSHTKTDPIKGTKSRRYSVPTSDSCFLSSGQTPAKPKKSPTKAVRVLTHPSETIVLAVKNAPGMILHNTVPKPTDCGGSGVRGIGNPYKVGDGSRGAPCKR